MNERMHFTFLARSDGGALKPRNQKEILEAEWYLPDELPALIQPSWLRDFLLTEAPKQRRNSVWLIAPRGVRPR